jgi:hypothetical protein
MYALAQCWMQQGILGSFRRGTGAVTADSQQKQQQAGSLDLSPWFDSLLVRLVILVSEGDLRFGSCCRLLMHTALCCALVQVHGSSPDLLAITFEGSAFCGVSICVATLTIM